MRTMRTGLGGILTATALMLGLPLVAGPSPTASADSDDIVAIVLEGTGLGHGRGMSQWGAYGYAVDHGWDWEDILDHYYGGTDSGTVNTGQRIKVRLLAMDGQSTVGVVSHGSQIQWNGQSANSMYAKETSSGTFEIYSSSARSCPGAATLTVPDGPLSIAPTTFSSAVRDFQQFLDIYHDSTIAVDGYFGPQTLSILIAWQQAEGLTNDGLWNSDDAIRARAIIAADSGASFSLIGTDVTTTGNPVRFTIANGDDSSIDPDKAIGLCQPNRSIKHYRGAIEVLSISSGNRVVSDIEAEDYVRGVVPKEISALWANAGEGAGANAVRAQAVAARSYGLQQSRNYFFDGTSTHYATTCDSTSCQVYGGAATRQTATGGSSSVEHELTDAAILATANVVRRWPTGHASAGQLVSTEFSASNGPRTAGGAFPAVNDIGDDTTDNPNHKWTRVLDADSLEASFGLGQLTSATMIEPQNSVYQQYDGIWFNDIMLTGTGGSYRNQAWDFRGSFGLPSPGFTVRVIRESTSTNSFGLIGDSVGNSIAHSGSSEFRQLTDDTFTSATIDVYDSRCTTELSCPGLSGVEVAQGLPEGLNLVVVELGYNDAKSTFATDINEMMTALSEKSVGQVAWINMADIRTDSGGSRYASMNDDLALAASQWSNLSVLDWNVASSHTEARARWFSDGVHLTTTGQAEFALWLRDQAFELAPSHRLAPPKRIELPIIGEELTAVDGSTVAVPVDAASVALNVTAVRPSLAGFASVWSCSDDEPSTSNLNFESGEIVANSVIAPIADDGTVCLYSSVGTDILVDVAGWFAGGDDPAIVAVAPQRFVDTRSGLGRATRISPGDPLVLDLGGAAVNLPDGTEITVPDEVAAFSLNVTAVRPDDNGFLTVYQCSGSAPDTSNVNYVANRNVGNGVVAPVGADGAVCVSTFATTHILVDLLGWFPVVAQDPPFTPATPLRLVDSRFGIGGRTGKVARSSPVVVPIHGVELMVDGVATTIPNTASAAAVSVIAIRPDGDGFLTLWPCDSALPEASNVNYRDNQIVANAVVAPIGADGTICVYTYSPAHIVVDIAGWFSGGDDAGFVGAVPNRFVDTRFAVGPVPV